MAAEGRRGPTGLFWNVLCNMTDDYVMDLCISFLRRFVQRFVCIGPTVEYIHIKK